MSPFWDTRPHEKGGFRAQAVGWIWFATRATERPLLTARSQAILFSEQSPRRPEGRPREAVSPKVRGAETHRLEDRKAGALEAPGGGSKPDPSRRPNPTSPRGEPIEGGSPSSPVAAKVRGKPSKPQGPALEGPGEGRRPVSIEARRLPSRTVAAVCLGFGPLAARNASIPVPQFCHETRALVAAVWGAKPPAKNLPPPPVGRCQAAAGRGRNGRPSLEGNEAVVFPSLAVSLEARRLEWGSPRRPDAPALEGSKPVPGFEG